MKDDRMEDDGMEDEGLQPSDKNVQIHQLYPKK